MDNVADPVAVLGEAGHLSWLLACGGRDVPDPFVWPVGDAATQEHLPVTNLAR